MPRKVVEKTSRGSDSQANGLDSYISKLPRNLGRKVPEKIKVRSQRFFQPLLKFAQPPPPEQLVGGGFWRP